MIDRVALVYFVNTMADSDQAQDLSAPYVPPEPVTHLHTAPAAVPASALSSI